MRRRGVCDDRKDKEKRERYRQTETEHERTVIGSVKTLKR
jgi:hypothetical protein